MKNKFRSLAMVMALAGLSMAFLPAAVQAKTSKKWSAAGKPAFFSAGRADYVTMAFHPLTREPYVAYIDIAHSSRLSVMKMRGKRWVYVGAPGFSPGSIGLVDSISLAFNPVTKEPHVVFEDETQNGKLTAMRFDGTNWQYYGTAGFTPDTGLFPSLSFNASSGQAYVAFEDESRDFKASIMYYSNGNWYSFASGISDSYGVAPSLANHPTTNELYIAYRDDANAGKLTVKTFSPSTGWRTLGAAGFTSGLAENISLLFNPVTKEPYVSFCDYGNDHKATVMRFDGSNWVVVGDKAGFSNGAVGMVTMAFSKSNQLYVAFTDNSRGNKATVMKLAGSQWKTVGKAGLSKGGASYLSIAFRPGTNAPYLAYSDSSKGSRLTAKKYITPNR